MSTSPSFNIYEAWKAEFNPRLLVGKSTHLNIITNSTQTILNVLQEINNHKEFCAKFGITQKDLENTPEAAATTAYGAYILDVGLQGALSRIRIGRP